ncbi:19c9a825-6b0e-4d99-a851-fafb9b4e9e4d [Sclerotinia trifoliorum]|uniref:19c9a825-6b0e-4d99-a851-fafb9b4e9e4d n=1 Tax=Sclerotinia trifoliorum TaxID=28548 RepID=A0A8H2VR33_9HELO|nr:19c9a825-6b0e-4d99-a851-fafb9b4e9e4d [Sclerotinia trifoliorum]
MSTPISNSYSNSHPYPQSQTQTSNPTTLTSTPKSTSSNSPSVSSNHKTIEISADLSNPDAYADPDLDLRTGDEEKQTAIEETLAHRTRTNGTQVTTASWRALGPPPDGGLRAWIQVILSHLVIMNTWGFINSFGVFQTYYVSKLQRPASSISWIGSVQIFLLFFIGTFTGRLTDAGYFRSVFLVGTIIGLVGIFMASISTTYWQVFLAQGICMGLGNGCLFCPALATLSTYFSTKKSLVIGIAAAGSATGGVIFPIMVQQLLPRIGYGWTMRSLGLIQLVCLGVCNLGIRQRVPPRKSGALIDYASFKDIPYMLFAAGMFFNFWGIYFAFYYLGAYARTIIGLPLPESITIIIILNAVGIIGRILPNHLADRYFGPLNTLLPITLINSLLCFCWIAVSSRKGLYAWAIMYGIFAAGIQGLFPATLSSLTTDMRKAGVRMGMVFTVVSFAVLTGPPIGGVLVQRKAGSYEYAQIFVAGDLFVGWVFLLLARRARSRAWGVKM